jgi:hypothetical protein
MPEYLNGCFVSINVCNADESSHDYKLVFNKTGLRQINLDRSRELGVGIDGDLVVWQLPRRANGTENSDVFAYNITQDKIYAIGWESYYFDTLFEISRGRVIVDHGTNQFLPDSQVELPRKSSLMLWDEKTQDRRILNTGLGGGPSPMGFDGSWAAFVNSKNDDLNNSGLFAMNVDSGQVVPLYIDGQHPNSTMRADEATVVDGLAYYEVHPKSDDLEFWLHEVNLTTKEDRVVHHGTGSVPYGSLRASGRHLVWFALGNGHSFLYHFDRLTGQGEQLTDESIDKPRATISVGGDWVVYQAEHPGGGQVGIVGIHIPTKTRIVLIEDDEHLFPDIVATDGKRFVASLWRNDQNVYETLQQDLYWGNLPNVSGGSP